MFLKDCKLEDFTEEYQAKLLYLKAYEGKTYSYENSTFEGPIDLALYIYFNDLEDYAAEGGTVQEQIEIALDYIEDYYSLDFLTLFEVGLEFPYPKLKGGDFSAIQYFHKSIYEANREGYLSPLEAWKDKYLIFKTAVNRLKYIGRCRPSDILQGFSIAKVAPKVSVFKPKLAQDLVEKYLKDYKEVFDPFSGFSGRLIGVCNSKKNYIGQDLNKTHIEESLELAKYLKLENYQLQVQNILEDSEKSFEALFTCPPYGSKESWNSTEDVSKTCDEWIEICLSKYKCKSYLFVVDETEKYKDFVVETITNKSHFGSNFEKVILIRKDDAQ